MSTMNSINKFSVLTNVADTNNKCSVNSLNPTESFINWSKLKLQQMSEITSNDNNPFIKGKLVFDYSMFHEQWTKCSLDKLHMHYMWLRYTIDLCNKVEWCILSKINIDKSKICADIDLCDNVSILLSSIYKIYKFICDGQFYQLISAKLEKNTRAVSKLISEVKNILDCFNIVHVLQSTYANGNDIFRKIYIENHKQIENLLSYITDKVGKIHIMSVQSLKDCLNFVSKSSLNLLITIGNISSILVNKFESQYDYTISMCYEISTQHNCEYVGLNGVVYLSSCDTDCMIDEKFLSDAYNRLVLDKSIITRRLKNFNVTTDVAKYINYHPSITGAEHLFIYGQSVYSIYYLVNYEYTCRIQPIVNNLPTDCDIICLPLIPK